MIAVVLAAMATTLDVGTVVYINYVGNNEWHERVILGHIDTTSYMVVTPDFDIFAEDIQLDAFIESFRLAGAGGTLPIGIPAADVYGFDPLSPAQRQELLAEGKRLTIQEQVRRGVAVGGVGVGVGLPAALVMTFAAATTAAAGTPILAGAAGGWYVDEPCEEAEVGDEYTLPAGAPNVNGRALVGIGLDTVVLRQMRGGTNVGTYVRARLALLSNDPRVISPLEGRRRTFTEAVHTMEAEARVTGAPQPIQGPATAEEWLGTVAAQGHVSLLSRHHKWISESGIKHTDRLVYEHEVISRTLDVAMVWDGVNIKNTWFAELLLRRLQLLEHAVSEDPHNPSYEGAMHFMGATETAGAYVAPALQTFVATELGKQTAILKEKRKSREAKAARAKQKGDGKGAKPT